MNNKNNIPAVILCGGKGTRLSEETINKPKPLVEICGRPILWHIMKSYSSFGIKKFILALGYKGDQIKQYFYNYKNTSVDFSLKMDTNNQIKYLSDSDEKDWEIIFVDTGQETLKGGRIKRIQKYVESELFHLTYGDGVCDVNINNLVDFHNSHNSIGTVTAVRPPSRFGELNIDEQNTVLNLEEKAQMGRGLINGGYFVFNNKIFSYLTEDKDCDFEFGPLQEIAELGELKAFKHDGFWQCMDNVREQAYLTNQIKEGKAPWIRW